MKITQLQPDEALASLHSSRAGLSSAEAARRLAEYGPNRVEEGARQSLFLRFISQFSHFFALILWLATGLAAYAEWRDPGQGMGKMAIAVLTVILVNGLFSFWQEYRAERAIAALKALLPRQVTALRDGRPVRLPAEALVPGDVVTAREGDEVPADCRLIECAGLRVNMATLTGEAAPKPRSAGSVTTDDMLHARNVLLAGTSIVGGEGAGLVFATGMRTEFGKIAHLTQSTQQSRSPLQQEIERLSRLVAMLAAALGAGFFVVGHALGLDFWANLLFAIGIIVANVPEGLLPTVTLALAMATQRMARRNALIRHLPAAEALGSATVICTDKTGTLTENRMSAKRVCFAEGIRDLTELEPASLAAHLPFFEAARHCHNVTRVIEQGEPRLLGDPTELALLEMGERVPGLGPAFERCGELPFDADRMRMSSVHEVEGERRLYCKGALESMLPLCSRVFRAGEERPLDEAMRAYFLAAQEEMAEQGYRVLAIAWRRLPADVAAERWEEDMVLLGLAGLEDPPRPEVPAAIAQCRAAGIRVIMITGDYGHTAGAIAQRIGLADSPHVVRGDQLSHMSEIQLQLALDIPEIVFARVSADQKMRIVDALKRKGHVVAVTGDGVNDAPALKRADIGIAMGVVGTDVARESADMILLDDNFASIVAAIEEGRAVFQNIRKFLTYILSSNIPEIVPYLAFVLLRIPLPLTVIQILAVDLGTDMLPALALGAERPAPDTLQQSPRSRREGLLSWQLLVRAYLWLGIMEAVAAMAAFFYVLQGGGWSYGEMPSWNDPLYRQATTACLVAIIMMQVMNVFLCRDSRHSSFSRRFPKNSFIGWGVGAEMALILAIVYTPWGNELFGTAPITLETWLFVLPFAAAMAVLEEARKWVVRRATDDHRKRSGERLDHRPHENG